MRKILFSLAALALSGCVFYGSDPDRVRPIVRIYSALSQCGIPQPGIYSPAGLTTSFSPKLQRQLEDAVLPEGRQALVVAIGERPTPGWGLTMVDARWFGEATLNINMLAYKPDPDEVVAQVVTEPCVIIDVPSAGWTQVRVDAEMAGFPVAFVRRDED